MEETVQKIKRQLRLSMNGVVSSGMRQLGVEYRMNFGVTLPLLKKIAAGYAPDPDLALRLWSEDIRESKILASLLCPVQACSKEMAREWVKTAPQTEIIDYCCMNLFDRLPFAIEESLVWINMHEDCFRYAGVQLFSRAYVKNRLPHEADLRQFIRLVQPLLTKPDLAIKTAVMNTLKKVMGCNREASMLVLKLFGWWKNSKNPLQKVIYDDLKLEYDICMETKCD